MHKQTLDSWHVITSTGITLCKHTLIINFPRPICIYPIIKINFVYESTTYSPVSSWSNASNVWIIILKFCSSLSQILTFELKRRCHRDNKWGDKIYGDLGLAFINIYGRTHVHVHVHAAVWPWVNEHIIRNKVIK